MSEYQVTDSDRIAELEDKLKIAEDEIRHLRQRVRALDMELDSEK
jgi:hypothetical protein